MINLRVNYYAHSLCAGVMFCAGLAWLMTITSMQHRLFRSAPPAAQHYGWRYTLKSAGVWLVIVAIIVNVVFAVLMGSSSWQGVDGMHEWSQWSQNALVMT